MTAPLLALAIPLLDAGISVIRRFLRHQPIFGADRGHIHHRLLARGFTARSAAILLYVVCGVGAALSLVLDALQNEFAGIIVVLFCVSAWIGIQHLGYVEFAAARQLFVKGTFRRIIDFQTRLQEFEEALRSIETLDECWKLILTASREFGFHGVRMYVQGQILDEVLTPNAKGPFWQMRIPLSGWQYVNFTRAASADQLNPIVLGGFAESVTRGLLKVTSGAVQTEQQKAGILLEDRR